MRFLLLILSIMLCFETFSKPLKIASLSYPPFTYLEGNRPTGIAVDIVSEIMSRLDIEYEIIILPWPRVLLSLHSGAVDAVFPLLKKSEREEYTTYPDVPIIYESVALFVNYDSEINYEGSLASIAQYKICQVRGYSLGDKWDSAIKNGVISNVDLASSSELNLKKLLYHRCQILVDEDAVVHSLLNNLGYLPEDISAIHHLTRNPSYLAFAKTEHGKQLAQQVSPLIKKMRRDGTIQKIVERYLGKGAKNWPEQSSPTNR
ncbi:transporter substrate-binding domain-containing protein [Vibrio profundum]|uniref:substrate-binding periplasmic protein n=1 Tax=Vibrio profundum TaxID=2910247 RepID=UPI003D0FE07F